MKKRFPSNNLYGMVGNNPSNKVDYLGRQIVTVNGHNEAVNLYNSNFGGSWQAGDDVLNDVKDEDEPKEAVQRFMDSTDPPGCSKTGVAIGTINVSGSSNAFQTYNLVLGRVVVKFSGSCDWECGCCKREFSLGGLFGVGGCNCKYNCRVTFSFTDTYDFTPHSTDSWLKQFRDNVYGTIAGEGTAYTISGDWTEDFKFERRKTCSVK